MSMPSIPLSEALQSADVFVDGDWVESKDQDPDGDVRLIQLADVGDGIYLDKSSRFLTKAKARGLNCTFLKEGDLLVARMPDPLGRACIFPGDTKSAVTVVDVCIIRPKRDGHDAKWLMHTLNAPNCRQQIDAFATGTTRSRISRSNLGKIRIPNLPLAEQQRIAEVLDRAEGLRAKRRAALAQLDTLTQSIFLDLFGDPLANPRGWPRLSLGSLLTNIDSGWSPTCLDRPVVGDEWGVLKLGAVTWCEYDSAENKALPPEIAPDPRLEVKAGDLLFTRKNTYDLVAACALVRSTPPKLLMSDLIFRLRLRPDAEMDARFLHQLLTYPTKRKEIQKLAGGSASSMPNISKERLQSAPVEKPPLALQLDFARRLEQVEKLKTTHRNALSHLNHLFFTLQHRAFLGELWK